MFFINTQEEYGKLEPSALWDILLKHNHEDEDLQLYSVLRHLLRLSHNVSVSLFFPSNSATKLMKVVETDHNAQVPQIVQVWLL